VRALLAKAESTPFEAEAEACTAKAQELMTRHALWHALLDHDHAPTTGPEMRRLDLDKPYISAKAFLLGSVASANRCRVVWSREQAVGTVFGYPADLDAVELLFTSLLIQVTQAAARAGPLRDATGTTRTRSFRRSFILGFAKRVGERLRLATEETARDVAAAGGEDRLLPVLAQRSDLVDDLARATFPGAVSRTQRISNGQGFREGCEAGDRASITSRSPIADARRAAIERGAAP